MNQSPATTNNNASTLLTRFDHITVIAESIDKAKSDYVALLGHAPTWQGAHAELGTEGALFGLDNAIIELTAPLAASEASSALRDWILTHGEGLQAIAWGTDDAAQCSATLRARGGRATPPQPGQARDAQGRVRDYATIDLSPRTTRNLPLLIVERSDFSTLTRRDLPPHTLHALDHVVIHTADIEAAKQLYGAVLGIRLALERDLQGTRMLFFRAGGVTLEVIEDPALDATDRFYGAAYRTRDIHAAHARLRDEGFALGEPRPGNKPGTTVFTVRDRTHGVPTLVIEDPSRT